MSYILLKVQEGNEPLLEVTAQKRLANATLAPFNLAGASITMTVKATRDTADGSAIATYSTGSGTIIITDAPNGSFTVQLSTAATAATGLYFYKVNATTGGHPQTLMHGDFLVENV